MSESRDSAGFTYVWSYQVHQSRLAEFEKLYGSEGGWARFFRKSPNYLGTELLRDRKKKNRYLTIDRWSSAEAHRSFVSEHRAEFEKLDQQGEALTESETFIGDFDRSGDSVLGH